MLTIKDEKMTRVSRGFSLVELLTVIGIVAGLSVTIVVIVNPVEALKKTRDTRRMSDLNSISDALTLYVSSVPNPDLDGALSNGCFNGDEKPKSIFYSAHPVDISSPACVDSEGLIGSDALTSETNFSDGFCVYRNAAKEIDGTGWIPVDLSAIPGGSPLASLPVDPINDIDIAHSPNSTKLAFRYACQNDISHVSSEKPSLVFEIDAILESDAFTKKDNKAAKDGGDNLSYYEVGSSLNLIGNGTNF